MFGASMLVAPVTTVRCHDAPGLVSSLRLILDTASRVLLGLGFLFVQHGLDSSKFVCSVVLANNQRFEASDPDP